MCSCSDCSYLTIELIPQSNSPTTAYRHHRNQDFYILSEIKLNCNESLSALKKWSIRNYLTQNSYFNKKLIMAGSDLYLPLNTLPYGIYQLELTVTMIDYSSLTNSASVYVEISPSGILVNLVPLGTSVITSGHQQNLTFNPGNYSIDPDGYPFNASVCFYIFFAYIFVYFVFR